MLNIYFRHDRDTIDMMERKCVNMCCVIVFATLDKIETCCEEVNTKYVNEDKAFEILQYKLTEFIKGHKY